MTKKQKIRNVSFVLIGVMLLIIKQKYSGPYLEFIRSYLGNISVSFAVYFIVQFSDDYWKANKIVTAFIAIIAVNLFELTNGFGVMTNVYDGYDMLVNFVGVLLALMLDGFTKKYNLENKH